VEQRVLDLRKDERRGQDWIGPELGLAPRTVSAILRRHQVAYLHECDPLTGEIIRSSKATAIRYEHDHPGSLTHMDVKKVGKIPDGGGWKAHGRQMGRTGAQKRARIGFDYVHSLVDDHSRLAYSEILPDEKGPTCAGFLLRAAAYFATFGITRIEQGDDRQPLVLPSLGRHRQRHGNPGRQTRLHPSPLPLAERESGALQPHPAGRVGLPPGLPHQRRPQRRTGTLAGVLQHWTTPLSPRGPPANQPTVMNVSAEYI
jgi:hypothetical protein